MNRIYLVLIIFYFFSVPISAQNIKSFKDCDVCPEMVVIPPGIFQMGANRIEPMRGGEMRPQGPPRNIKISEPFAAGKYEVTVGEWEAYIQDTNLSPSNCSAWGGENRTWGHTWKDPDYGIPQDSNFPVVCVSWLETKQYTQWLSEKTQENYRLLTEAEWEYIANANTKSIWPWGNDSRLICQYGNVLDIDGLGDPRIIKGSGTGNSMAAQCRDGYSTVAPVGQYKANNFGIHDTIGNVWEWTQDCSFTYYPENHTDGSAVEAEGLCEKRAVRSGGWRTRVVRNRSTFRGRDPENTSYQLFGFRIARDIR